MWNGYCPESWLQGKKVRMRLNRNDFYESEETRLQIAVFPGVQAIILKFRGEGDFRSAVQYADEIENGEMPRDIPWTGKIIQDICYRNAENYFNWKEEESGAPVQKQALASQTK